MQKSEYNNCPDQAPSFAGPEKRWRRILVTTSLLALLAFGIVQLHSLPLVQEVKTSFRESGIDVSAFTYSDVEEYRDIKAGLRASPVR